MRPLPLVRVALLALTLLAGPAAATPRGLTAGAVASPDRFGALAAQEVLKAGGNAVDAVVATAFALAVTYPEAGNLGGGGFIDLTSTASLTSWTTARPPRPGPAPRCTWTPRASRSST